ncbi:pol polyprotein [Tanacetum coccineum]
MVAILTNTGSDFVCVRNSFDDETYKEARTNEASLFKTHHLLSNLDKSTVGIHALAQKLVLLQLASISKCSHEIVRKINEDLKMCVVEQNKQLQPFTTISEAMPAVLEIIKVSQKSLYKIIVSREYNYYQEDTQMHCHTYLVEMLNDFSKQLKSNHLNGYENFLADEIQLLEESKTLCLILNVLVSHAQNYLQLTQSVKKAAKNVIANTKECFKGKVFEFIKIKNMDGYTYTHDPRVISSLNKLKESHDRVFEAMRFVYDKRAELLKVWVRVFHLKSYPKNIVSEAFDIKVRIVALLETVLHMFIGFVESHLLLILRGMVENDMEAKLVNELRSDGENRYKPLPKESPLMTTKQWKLKNRIALLEKFKKVVEEKMDKISFHEQSLLYPKIVVLGDSNAYLMRVVNQLIGTQFLLRNELKCVQNGVNINEISCLKVRIAIETNVTAHVNVIGVPVTNTVANHAEKPEKFNGQNFKRWQQKMFFYLTTLNLSRFLNEIAPQVEPPTEGQPSNAQAMQAVEAWKHSDFLCHNYVLNGLVDDLYNVYCKTTTAKELWESLERKYKTEDASIKKFVVLLHNIYAGGMNVSEAFQVAAIIEKLPPSWVDFKNYLKHKQKEMSVEDLIVRLRIEVDNKLAQKNTYAPDSAKANMVKHAGSSSKSNSKAKGKGKKKNDKQGKGRLSHRAANCKIQKRVNLRQANMVNDNVDIIVMVSDVIAMISEVNLVGSNNSGWWVDTGATRHVCADKSMFHSFRAVDNGEKLYMGNSATADIKGVGDVILKMTSEKELKLTNSDKFVLSKNQMHVGKGYAVNGMFKLNVMVVKNNINKMNSSTYLIEFCNVWHGRLGHGEAILTATYLLNKIPRKEKEETPYELWMGRKPSYQYLRVWGCLAKVVMPTPKAQKIGPKSVDCIFIRYAKNNSAYHFIIHDLKNPDIQKNVVMESRNASFFEKIFPCLTKETGSSSRLDKEVV